MIGDLVKALIEICNKYFLKRSKYLVPPIISKYLLIFVASTNQTLVIWQSFTTLTIEEAPVAGPHSQPF